MKKCLKCKRAFSSIDFLCPSCGSEPAIGAEGFLTHAPALEKSGGGFLESHFAELSLLEGGNFWFRSRNRLIVWALKKYAPEIQSFLEIGCGTGYVLSGIAKAFPDAELRGAELFAAGLAFAAARQPGAHFMQMDARCIPYVDEFDVVGAFDVLEHIEEDVLVMTQIRDALKYHGIMLLTVPQHAWLWSPADEYACHVRRYSANELHEKIRMAGFEVLRSTSFVSALLPAMWASRFSRRDAADKSAVTAELRISPLLNRSLEMVMDAEIAMIRCGMNFPVGGSRLVVARKI